MPRDEAAGDASFKGATRVAANEAVADAELVEGLERPETETSLFLGLHADTRLQAEISQRPAALHHLEFVSLDGLGLRKKNKNLLRTVYCGDSSQGSSPTCGAWLPAAPICPCG